MPRATLETLLERNRSHAEALRPDHFEGMHDAQHPAVVTMCCSDSRVSQEGMWSVREPGWEFTPSNIGNRVWKTVDGERVVTGSILYPLVHTDTRTAVVVGHTGCGAITAAYDAVESGGIDEDEPVGIRRSIESLTAVVSDAVDRGAVDPDAPRDLAINRLVEYNVREQVAFLEASEDVPEETTAYGFVYDLHGAYGGAPGTAYLVAAEGETDPDALRSQVPDGYESHVETLSE